MATSRHRVRAGGAEVGHGRKPVVDGSVGQPILAAGCLSVGLAGCKACLQARLPAPRRIPCPLGGPQGHMPDRMASCGTQRVPLATRLRSGPVRRPGAATHRKARATRPQDAIPPHFRQLRRVFDRAPLTIRQLVSRASYSEANLTVVLETAEVLPCFAVARMS